MSVRLVGNSDYVYGRGDRILVVGAGPAGWSTVSELRRLGFPGELMVIGGEPIGPYDRTACSKGLINGHQKPRDLALDLRGCPDVIWRTGQHAIGLDPVARRVLLDTGDAVAYDGLVIATGSRSTLPRWWPDGEPGLFPLHSMGEAMALRRAMHTARHIAVIGGGLTGCELACSAVAMARKATVINSQRYLMPRAIGEPVGQLVTAAHRAAGINLRVGVRVSHIDRWRRGWRVVLDDDTVVDSDLVVLTAGETPDVEWLAGTNLDISDGVLCDETLRAVGEDGIVAVGALARWPNLRYSHQPTMVGQWIAALEHGQAAARTLMTGYDAPPVTVVPRFWSDQFGLRIQVCGQLDGPGEVGLTELRPGRRDTARAGVLASYTQAGALTGVVAVNAPRAFNVAARMLLSEPMPSYLGAAVPEPVGVPEPVSVPEPVREEMAMVARQPERRLRAV